MKKTILVVLFLIGLTYGLSQIAIPFTFTPNTPALSSQVNTNFSTVTIGINTIADTVNAISNGDFVRFNPSMAMHDSVLKYIRIDSIRSNPDIDSIQGKPYIDSITSTHLNLTDSIYVGKGARIEWALSADSLLTNGARVTNSITTDSVLANGIRATGSITTADSVITKGIRATSNIRGDSLIADRGSKIFGSLTAVDSVITKGIRATANIKADSLVATTGVNFLNGGSVKGNLAIDSITIPFLTIKRATAGQQIIKSGGTLGSAFYMRRIGKHVDSTFNVESGANGVDCFRIFTYRPTPNYNEFVIDPATGYVGIGSLPLERLHVDGNIRQTTLAGSGNRAVYSDPVGTLTNSSSDSTLKTDCTPITNNLDKVNKLKPINFYWKDKNKRGAQKEIGLLAQEVKDIVPEVVGMNYSDSTYTVDYAKLTALLIGAIKELSIKVDSLENRSK